jgi:RNA polymerase sigma-70 factor (ECF subfamily)
VLAPSVDSTLDLPLISTARVERAPSALEQEVARLFDELRNPVLRYLLRLGLPAADGDEVVQEVFLALFQHLRQGKSNRNLRGWVFRVAHNLGLKRRYSAGSRRMVTAGASGAAERHDPAPNPEELMANRQRQQRLLAVVSALPEHDRCCLHLRAEGLRYREIAEVLGISLGAVSLSLQRSFARLIRADR